MSSYALMLEMRKKKMGFFVHLFHFLMTFLLIGAWLPVWVVHYLLVRHHNRKIDDQIDRIIIAEAADARTKS